ncbi:MAG: iron-containing alcohol dehydrogenase [Anaerostipes sp.]|nr:iron-containing alcohol dehydrogenase [Anaerostipes sp.]
MDFNFTLSTHIIFGKNSIEKLPELLKELNAKKIMLIYDGGVKAAGISEIVEKQITKEGNESVIFDKVFPNPTDELVEEAAEIAIKQKVQAIVAVGGGSAIDLAKAVNILLTNEGPINRYSGMNQVKNATKPLIAIPTTAGTSSEITDVIALIDTKKVCKYVIIGKNVPATHSIIDPCFTKTMPASVTAATGMDAMTHAIESYLSVMASPVTDFQSLKGLEILSENLEQVVSHPDDLEAREQMMLGCVITGFAFTNANLGLVHGIAHTLSAHFNLPHGMANAAVLPYVVKFNAEAVPQRITEIAKALKLDITGDAEEDTKLVVDKLLMISKAIGIKTLKEQGIEKDSFDMLADDVLMEPVLNFNPRQGITKEEIIEILNQAY